MKRIFLDCQKVSRFHSLFHGNKDNCKFPFLNLTISVCLWSTLLVASMLKAELIRKHRISNQDINI